MDRATGIEGGSVADASSISQGKLVTNNSSSDIFDEHYCRLQTDPDLRRRLIENPTKGLQDFFGAVPGDGKCRIEIIVQDPDTITIMLPAPPESIEASNIESKIDAASSRIYDVLFKAGVGGYFIPSTSLTWMLRDFRSKVAGKSPPPPP